MRRAIECVVVAVCLLMVATTCDGTTTTTTTVFSDALASPFQDWSWAPVNMNYTSIVHSGTKAISFIPINNLGFYIRATQFINVADFTGIQFWVYRPPNSSTDIDFALVQDGGDAGTRTGPGPIPTLLSALGGSWPVNTWCKAFISFSDYNPGMYDGMWIMDNSGSATNPAVIFDDIALINSATGNPPATTTKSPTHAPTPSPSNVDTQIAALYTTATVGLASYVGYSNGVGSCGLELPASAGYPVVYSVAIGNYLSSRTCGMCLSVSGFPTQPYSRKVFVDNKYGGAANLAIEASGNGLLNISYKAIPCPITIGMEYVFKAATGPLYMAVMPLDTVYPVYKFAVLVSGKWVYLTRQANNIFAATFSVAVNPPYHIQVTSVRGEVLTEVIQDPWAPWGNTGYDATVPGTIQFTPQEVMY